MGFEFKNEQLKYAIDIITCASRDIHEHAQELMHYVDALITRRKVRHLYDVKAIHDILLASAYLYRLYYEDNKPSTLFLLREKASPIFSQYHIDTETQARIYQMCECHMGEEALIEFLIPQKGYPDDLFADAIFMMNLAESRRAISQQ